MIDLNIMSQILKYITVNNTNVGAIILVYKNLFLCEILNFLDNIKDIKFIQILTR